MFRHELIRVALRALSLSRAPRWLPGDPDVAGFVVTLHHVLPGTIRNGGDFQPNALLAITPEFLDRLISHFLSEGWAFVSVDELVAQRGAGEGGHRRIAVTLDDGYRDNLDHAWPVFQRHAVPFTIYVTPGFCDRTAELWWEALERVIAGTESLTLPDEGPAGQLPTRTLAEKARAFQLWTAWLTTVADEDRQRSAIRALAAQHRLDLTLLAEQLVMGWSEIRAMAADPLCTIGAHTMTHPALARLPADAALAEMITSADRIEREIGVRPTSIAFPYGTPIAAGSREAELAEKAGFAASFTTRPGSIAAGGSRQGLPRISINGLFQDVRYLDVLLSPAIWRLRRRMLKGRG